MRPGYKIIPNFVKSEIMPFLIFHRPKPRPYNYRPLYYDPVKEEIEERRKELEGIQEGDRTSRLRAELRRRWHKPENKADKTYNLIRTLIFLGVFIFAIYILFFTDFLTRFFTFFMGN